MVIAVLFPLRYFIVNNNPSLFYRSDLALQSSSCCKKINFNNLDDIKIKVEIEVPKQENNVDEYFKDGETSICYNNTIIKKVEPNETDVKNEEGPLSVLDFLNTIKDDDENDFNDVSNK